MILDLLYNTLVQGSLLAIICIGYIFAYGFAKVINFAHPDIMIFGGGYLVLFLISGFPTIFSKIIFLCIVSASFIISIFFYFNSTLLKKILASIVLVALVYIAFSFSGQYSFWLSFVIAIPITSVLALVVYIIGYYPLLKRNAPRNSILLSALGFSIAIESIMLILFGSTIRTLPTDRIPSYLYFSKINTDGYFTVFNSLNIPVYDLIIISIFVIILSFLYLFLKKSNIGRLIIACSENHLAARACGIPVYKTLGIAFVIGGFIASIAGTLLILRTKSIFPTAGFSIGLVAFMACVMGGIGNIKGSVISAFIISFIISFAPAISFEPLLSKVIPLQAISYLPSLRLSDWSYGIVYLIVIIVIIFKPKGILSKQ
ncbi:MAG: branched-chain amino acid ABC transporter permease [Candidatus Kapaibacterium sp.]